MRLGNGLGMISYDWRQCPPDLPPPQGPAYYGPLAADVGTRTYGEFEPAPDVEMDSCPDCGLGGNGVMILGGLALLMFLMGKK
jgi:hypothetical protein